MTKCIFFTSFPGIEVRVTEHKRLPNCRPEFRCFYLPGFRRITIKVLVNHLYVDEQAKKIDLVYPSNKYNAVVKETDHVGLQISRRAEVISTITHYFERVEGHDCDTVAIGLHSFEGFKRKLLVRLRHNDKKISLAPLQ